MELPSGSSVALGGHRVAAACCGRGRNTDVDEDVANTTWRQPFWFCGARLALAGLCLMLGACAGVDSRGDLPTVASVDLSRYVGTWYEIARLPMWFQRHCVDSKAVYSSRPDGAVGVHNECVTNTGKVEQAEGVATVVDTKTNARLTVVFDNWFARLISSSRDGNYWILDLDPEYRTAMIGTPDRRYLWILSRATQLDEATYRRLVERAQQLGYPVSDLIRARSLSSS